MKPYDKITIIRNRHRARDLRRFRDLVETYFDRAEYDDDDLLMDWEGARAARAHINRALPRVIQIVQAAGLTRDTQMPGPAVSAVEVLRSIFNARYTDGAHQEVLDTIDMALGVYEASVFSAFARSVNPIYYVGALLGFVLQLPARTFRALTGDGRPKPSKISPDELIETRFNEMREWQARQFAESADQLSELAERLDFAERVLSDQRAVNRIEAPRVTTPV